MYAVARSSFCRNVAVVGRRGLAPARRDLVLGRASIKDTGPRRLGRWQSSVASSQVSTSSSTPPSHPEPSQTVPPPPPPPPRRHFLLRATGTLLFTVLTFTLGFTMAAAPAYETAVQIANPPSDEETLTLFSPESEDIRQIEDTLFNHPLTQDLLADPKYIASRPHLKIPPALRSQNLTGGTLLGPDKIAVPPLQFTTADGSTFVSLQYLGPALCGHPGIVHGGLLATLLDEGLARCCFPALPNKVAVTASLKVDYKKPTMAGQIVVLKAETTKVEGRKAWVKGTLQTLPDAKGGEGVVLCEGEALFIEPRQAATLRRVVN